MVSRSEQLHSHQFALHRVIGAFAMRDPDPGYSHLRRIGGGLFASIMIAALAIAGVGVYGALRPGGDGSWRGGSSVIVERETGARFVYLDGLLYPVVNYSSAVLILGSAQPSTVLVSRASLAGVPRGAPLGIVGAPDLLPTADDLVDGPWTLCSRSGDTGPADAAGAESVLLVGIAAGPAPQPLGARALIASDAGGELHLIWNSRRYPIRDPDIVLAAFAWSRQSAVHVSSAVLNAVPTGPDLGRIIIAAAGSRSIVDGHRVGEVVVVENQSGGRQFAAVRQDGLADITRVQAGLLLADGANGLGGVAKPMSQARYAAAPRSASLVPHGVAAPPATAPDLAPAAVGGVCATFASGVAVPQLGVAAEPPRAAGEVRLPARARASSAADISVGADWVAVPPGRGAIVEAMAGPGAPSGALAIVSDAGVRFPVPSRDVLATLGYPADQVTPQRLPAVVVALLPAGRALDPESAAQPTES